MLPVLWPQLTPGHSLFSHSAFASLTGPPGVRHNSFTAQPPDLLLRFYVYPLGFGLLRTLAHRLALYPVSVRRLLGFATPLPPLLSLLTAACGSLHLAVNTRDRTFTCKNCAMPGTRNRGTNPYDAWVRASFAVKVGIIPSNRRFCQWFFLVSVPLFHGFFHFFPFNPPTRLTHV